MAEIRRWSASCWDEFMLARIGRLFVIKTRWEVIAVIYALALGSVDRGLHYVDRFPGVGGWLLFVACTGVVFMAGAKLFDAVRADHAAPLPAVEPGVVASSEPSPLGSRGPVLRRGRSFLLPLDQDGYRVERESHAKSVAG